MEGPQPFVVRVTENRSKAHSLDLCWLPASLPPRHSPQAAAAAEQHPPKPSQSRIAEPGPPQARSVTSVVLIPPGTPSQEQPPKPAASFMPHKSSERCKCCRCCRVRKAKPFSCAAVPPYPTAEAPPPPPPSRVQGFSEERVIAVTFPEHSLTTIADLNELDTRPPPKPTRSLARKPAKSRRAVVETLSVHPSDLASAILADYAKPSPRRTAKAASSLFSLRGRPPSMKASRSQPSLRVTVVAAPADQLHTKAPSLPATPEPARVAEQGNAAQEGSRTPMEATPGPSITQAGNQKMSAQEGSRTSMEATPGPSITQAGNQKMSAQEGSRTPVEATPGPSITQAGNQKTSTVADAGISWLPSEGSTFLSPAKGPHKRFMHVSALPSTSPKPRSNTPKLVQPRTKLVQRHVQRDATRPPPLPGARWVQSVFTRKKKSSF
ncbi:hypothetical protein lerEdw1_010314 [Lerista edwardsae]|nr:hypothetical protein lerEdw1_010314 [Lerista edwardsae]